MTRLEGMLLGALVDVLPARPADEDLCHRGLSSAHDCPRCGRILKAHELVDATLRKQRKKDGPRRVGGRRQPLVDDGRGGKRVGERRQRARTMHVIDDHASPRDVALARSDLVGFLTKRL